MTEKPFTVTPETTLEEAARIMLEQQIGGLPVVQEDRLVGIITASDVMRAFLDMMGATSGGGTRIDFVLEGEEHGYIEASRIVAREGAQRDARTTLAKDIMSPDPIRISIDKHLHHLTALMHAYHVRRVPIVNGFDTTLEIVTVDDLVAQLGDEIGEIGKAISEEFPRGNA